MKRLLRSLTLSAGVCLILAPVCFAATPGANQSVPTAATQGAMPGLAPLHFGIGLYKAHKFDEAIGHLNASIAANPQSAPAHYYLASCYLGQGKYDRADAEYVECLKLHPPKDIASYADRMHKKLQGRRTSTAGGASEPEPGPPPTAAAAPSSDPRSFQLQLQEYKRQQHKTLIDAANGKLQNIIAQIDQIKRNLSHSDDQTGGRWRMMSGQVFDPNAASKAKISDLETQCMVIKNNCRMDCEKLDAQIDKTFGELQTQARSTQGNIKPILTSRSVYVRDYIHFSGEDAPPEYVVQPMKLTAGKYSGGR